ADAEEARDLYQDAVVKGFEQLGRLREPERLRSWWLSIALNGVRSFARRQRPEPAESLPERIDEDQPSQAARLEEREELERLRTELGALPPRQREVCRLRLVDGLSHTAIAELLGITPDASRASAYQALKRLREQLGAG
ncbi:MAG: sigma-70 family RNA polymerase sigma factor, partial [Planctomycetota bacterium]